MKDELQRLIAIIDRKLEETELIRKSQDWKHIHEAAERIAAELAAETGAKFGRHYDAYTIKLAGIRSSCTSGIFGLLANWRAAARRKCGA
ncbi:hypothetical protein M1D80_11940 [Phyllobacteriaceae bacterium JZ32]